MNYKPEEIARYLYNYLPDLLTAEERAAYKNMLVLKKIENAASPMMKKMLREKWFSSDKKVLELLEDGEDEFFRKIEQRVFHDNPDETFLNLCPKCNYLTVTPKAKQCRKCYYSWHDKIYR
jgi:hypothetical protein